MIYKLEQPDFSKIDKSKIFNVFPEKEELLKCVFDTFFPYIYWDKVKYKKIPDYVSHEEFWWMVKFIRNMPPIRSKSNIKNENGNYFSWVKIPGMEKFLHEMDLNTGGALLDSDKNFEESNKHKFISRGVMEEAIASSQLEGAVTTRKAALQFLREGKKPKNKSEHMILNNYFTMQAIENNYKNSKIDKNLLFELHAMITKNTLPENEIGRFRKDKEDIIVGNQENVIYHIPPKMNFVEKEIDRFIEFANDELGEAFIHPIVKAIMIHFWIGYLHPFTDGNGRLARLLFYWYLLKNNYWAFAYLPISLMIKKSPIQYTMAYVYSEQDDLDLSYFISYNIEKIEQAIKNFKEYVKEKVRENKSTNVLIKAKYNLNDRQTELLLYFHENKNTSTILKTYKNINKISKMTAIKDLKQLVEFGFLTHKKQGRNVFYYATDKIGELFA